MHVYLPVAGMTANLAALIGLGGLVGFLSGLLGVGGGFLLTPFLIMMGIDPVVAAASGTCSLAGASSSGTLAHLRAGNVDVPMGVFLLAGGMAGGGFGTWWVRLLRRQGNADVVIVAAYVILLALVGIVMFVEGLVSRVRWETEEGRQTALCRALQRLPFTRDFPASGVRTSMLAPVALGFLVGMMASLMGVGGGFFLIPAMTYALGMPIRVVIGTSLFQMLFTSAFVTVMQAGLNHSVDIILAMGIFAGSTLGAQAGAMTAKHVNTSHLKLLLALMVLALSLKMFNGLLQSPGLLFTAAGGG